MGTAVFMLEAFVKIHMLNRDRCELIWPTFHKVGPCTAFSESLNTAGPCRKLTDVDNAPPCAALR